MTRKRTSLTLLSLAVCSCPKPDAAGPETGLAGTDPPSSTAAVVAPEVPALSFTLVAERGATDISSPLRLFQTNDGRTFLASGPLLYVLGDDGSVEHDPSWVRGIEYSDPHMDDTADTFRWEPLALGGRWPDLYLVLEPSDEDMRPVLYRRRDARWAPVELRIGRDEAWAVALGPWLDAKTMARLRTASGEQRFVSVEGAAAGPTPPAGTIIASDSLHTGELFALIEMDGRPALVHHVSGSTSTTKPLPGAPLGLYEPGVQAQRPDQVWVFGASPVDEESTGYLAHFDGNVWAEVPTTCEATIASLTVDDKGLVHFVCRRHDEATLHRLETGKSTPIMGGPPGVWEVAATRSGDLWMLAGPNVGEPSQLWYTGSDGGAPIEISDAAEGVRLGLEWADPHPVDKGCARVWISLAPAVDAEQIERRLEAVYDDLHPQVRRGRVQGRTELGIFLPHADDEPGGLARVRRIREVLGDDAGASSCNERPPD